MKTIDLIRDRRRIIHRCVSARHQPCRRFERRQARRTRIYLDVRRRVDRQMANDRRAHDDTLRDALDLFIGRFRLRWIEMIGGRRICSYPNCAHLFRRVEHQFNRMTTNRVGGSSTRPAQSRRQWANNGTTKRRIRAMFFFCSFFSVSRSPPLLVILSI
jgi:hypothetical protein